MIVVSKAVESHNERPGKCNKGGEESEEEDRDNIMTEDDEGKNERCKNKDNDVEAEEDMKDE